MQVDPQIATELRQQIREAIAAHGQWKQLIVDAIERGSSPNDVSTTRRDDACAFGRWLYQSISRGAKGTGHYEEVRRLHAQFHDEAAAVLELALAGKAKEAQVRIARGGRYSDRSLALTTAMLRWLNDTGSSFA